jgi:hypothetical protein
MAAVTEASRSHPGQLVAAHRTADAAVGDDGDREPARLDQRHPPGGTVETAPAAALAVDVDGEPVAAALGPADDAAVDGFDDRRRHGRGCGELWRWSARLPHTVFSYALTLRPASRLRCHSILNAAQPRRVVDLGSVPTGDEKPLARGDERKDLTRRGDMRPRQERTRADVDRPQAAEPAEVERLPGEREADDVAAAAGGSLVSVDGPGARIEGGDAIA